MATKSKTDQFKILRDEISDIDSNVRRVRLSVDVIEDDIKLIRTDVKDFKHEIGKRFDDLEQKIFDWKSDLFTKIDNEYAKPIKDLEEEDKAKDIRLTRLEKRNPLN